jgi:hypothetical protein
MATATELLRLVIDADGRGAIQGLEKVGAASDRELGRADDKLKKVGASLTSFGATAVTAAGVASVGLFKLADAASAYGEQISAATKIFGAESIKPLEDFADAASETAGISKTLALQVSNNFGSLGKQAGFTGDQLVKFSTRLTQLGGDLASFKDTTVEEALQAIQSGLQGESEPLRRYGVFLDDIKLKNEAAAQGIYDGSGALTAQQKIAAAYNVILKETVDAQDDFVETSDSLANRQRQLKADFDNLKVEVGNGLVPVFETLFGAVSGVTDGFGSLSPDVQKAIGSFAGFATTATFAAGVLSFVGGKAIDLREKFFDVADGADGASRKLNGVGKAVAGIGAVGAIAGVTVLAGNLLQVARDASAARVEMEDLDEVLKALGNTANVEKFGRTFEDLVESLNDTEGVIEGILTDSQTEQVKRRYDELVNYIESNPIEGEKLIGELAGIGEVVEGEAFRAAGGLEGLRQAQERGIATAKGAAENQQALNDATSQGTTPFETLRAAVDEGTASLKDYADALDAVFNPTEAYFGAVEDGKQSQIDILTATKDVQDLFKFGATNTEEFRDAQQRLADANQSYFESLQGQDAALADFIDKNGTSAEAVQNAKDKIDLWVISGKLSVEQADLMKQRLDFVAGAANNAATQLDNLAAKSPVNVTVNADVQAAIDKVNAVKVAVDAVTQATQIAAFLGGLAGKGGAPQPPANAPNFGGVPGGGGKGFVRPRAMGGPVSANNPYLVGERGPELFVPNSGGKILPNGSTGGISIGSLTINGAEPEQTATATVRRMRDAAFLADV